MILLPLHIIGGLLAVVFGYLALFARKGGGLHLRTGMLFVYAMLTMTGSAMILAALHGQRVNLAQSILTMYLVVTGLLTVRPVAISRRLNTITMVVALGGCAFDVALGIEGIAAGGIDGLPGQMMLVFAFVALIAAIGDLRLVLGRTLHPRQRLARHLWRLGFATFVATGSFFLGQADEIPAPLRVRPVLLVLALTPLAVMFYWLVRVRRRVPERSPSGLRKTLLFGGGALDT